MDKEQTKKVIIDYLTKLGYPNILPQLVFNHLPAIWTELKKANLIPDGMIFEDLQNICASEYNNAIMEHEFQKAMANKKPPKVFTECTVVSSKLKS
jgi:hypothetical protein